MPGAHEEHPSYRLSVHQGPIKDAWDDDTKGRIASLSLSRMLPTGAKPRSSIRGRALSLRGSRAASTARRLLVAANGSPLAAMKSQGLNDDDNVFGGDAKTLRDATALAVTEVWNDDRSATSSLIGKVDKAASRLEDVMRLRAAVATSQQKADFIVCNLDGAAREKVEQLSQQERCDFAVVAHLKQAFEGPQHR
ncbi:hypothetical protein RB195_025414 [Necator americanus]|uniref:Uncharacterized protein n=1 Tax=Necator americanus TaxID=51031 RepID=A0ABR1ES70_NECAM